MKTETRAMFIALSALAVAIVAVVAVPSTRSASGWYASSPTKARDVRGGGEVKTTKDGDDCQKHNGFPACAKEDDTCSECTYPTNKHKLPDMKVEDKSGMVMSQSACG